MEKLVGVWWQRPRLRLDARRARPAGQQYVALVEDKARLAEAGQDEVARAEAAQARPAIVSSTMKQTTPARPGLVYLMGVCLGGLERRRRA